MTVHSFVRETGRDRGSAAMETVLLTPLLIVLVLFVVHAGRSAEGMSELRHAADQGARAASLVARTRMATAAGEAVRRDLAASGSSCERPSVTVGFQALTYGSSVRVDVRCWVSNIGLGLLGTSQVLLAANSTEIIDRYRGGP